MTGTFPLIFRLDINQNGGGELADFIPYSDHYKMDEEQRLANPTYCPDTHPFLCNKNSKANGYCRRTENQCLASNIQDLDNRIPLKYKLKIE